MRNISGVSRIGQEDAPYSTGFGFIVIPPGVERDVFVETCYRKERITIATDNGAVINDCYVLSEVLQKINFPRKLKERGSSVCFISCKFQNKPIIIGVLNSDDSSNLLEENMYRIRKRMGDTEIVIQLDPNKNNLVIGLTSKEDKEGRIFITSKGSEKSEINIVSSGKVNVKADKEINAISYKQISTKVIDVQEGKQEDVYEAFMDLEQFYIKRKNQDEEFSLIIDKDKVDLRYDKGNKEFLLNKSLVQIKTDKTFEVNGGAEPIPLGDTLIQKIDQLQTQIATLVNGFLIGMNAAIPIPTSDQGKAAFTAAYSTVSSIQKIDFSPTKSKVSFTD